MVEAYIGPDGAHALQEVTELLPLLQILCAHADKVS